MRRSTCCNFPRSERRSGLSLESSWRGWVNRARLSALQTPLSNCSRFEAKLPRDRLFSVTCAEQGGSASKSNTLKSQFIYRAVGILIGLVGVSAQAASPDSAGIEFFEKKIRPIFVENCYKCHSK